jgi:ankyrin repeat protein
MTPLHWAAREGHLEVVRLLLERGADKEARPTRLDRGALRRTAARGGGAWRKRKLARCCRCAVRT